MILNNVDNLDESLNNRWNEIDSSNNYSVYATYVNKQQHTTGSYEYNSFNAQHHHHHHNHQQQQQQQNHHHHHQTMPYYSSGDNGDGELNVIGENFYTSLPANLSSSDGLYMAAATAASISHYAYQAAINKTHSMSVTNSTTAASVTSNNSSHFAAKSSSTAAKINFKKQISGKKKKKINRFFLLCFFIIIIIIVVKHIFLYKYNIY